MSVNSLGYIHFGGDIRNITILLLLSLSYSATLLVPSEYSTIQSAIDASSDGDTILVSAGTYLENINFNGKNISVIGEDRETTIIDGGYNGSVVIFDSIEGTASALSNFTITGGNAYDGGGIYCSSSAPTIKDNIITGNVSDTYGGGISCNYSSPIIMNNTITSNSAIYGGGISFDRYTSSVIKGNNIHGNSAEEGGGIGCFTFSSPTITNNTIVGNSASTNGGGIYCYYVSAPNVTNTIIWDNTASTDPNISVYFSDPYFNYCDVMGSWEGEGNIDADPLFCDVENGDFTVQSDSPVLGAGQDGTDMGAYGVGCQPDDVCSACNIYYTDGYPGFCCDMAWDEGGLTCLYVEAEWGLDCGGCNCFGDLAFCEDEGLVMCSDYSCAESLSQCPPECDLGDVNCDGTLNVLDIVIAANMVLADEYDVIADMNEDGELNILDLVIMVNLVLFGDDGACADCGDSECCDCDGNVYETIQIGDQLWMAENLKVTHYRNGDEIPPGTELTHWTDDGYVVYNNDLSNVDVYGNLYNWNAVTDERGICPAGFHAPSDEEFSILGNYVGTGNENGVGFDNGGKLKEIGTEHWLSPNTGATNETQFTALPGGAFFQGISGEFFEMGEAGYYWTNSFSEDEYYQGPDLQNPIYYYLHYESDNLYRVWGTHFDNKMYGYSVRCLKD